MELAVTLSVNQWNGQTTLQLMMVDARVDGVQLFNIRSKSVELPEGVPVLDFTSDLPEMLSSSAIVVKKYSRGSQSSQTSVARTGFLCYLL